MSPKPVVILEGCQGVNVVMAYDYLLADKTWYLYIVRFTRRPLSLSVVRANDVISFLFLEAGKRAPSRGTSPTCYIQQPTRVPLRSPCERHCIYLAAIGGASLLHGANAALPCRSWSSKSTLNSPRNVDLTSRSARSAASTASSTGCSWPHEPVAVSRR
jgi:hypothetical protein